LIPAPCLRRLLGTPDLWIKDETRGPTGSNKDRASALIIEHAMRTGARTVSCASTGNVASSLAVAAAVCGVQAVVFVPADVADSKLNVMLLAGARVLKVAEGYEAAFDLSRRAACAFGWLDRNTGVNPMTVEAKKTVALEVWEQLGRRVPDVVVVPVGDGPTLCGMAKGFRELVACGVADCLPRLIGVQAEGCQPLKVAWEQGTAVRPVRPHTVADGIAVGAPISAAAVLRDLRESGGAFVAVPDEALHEAIAILASTAGLIAEPAGAAALAGLHAALASGLVAPGETIVASVTGTGLKTPHFLRPAARAVEIHADLQQVEQALDQAERQPLQPL
jgi:threonine synthase